MITQLYTNMFILVDDLGQTFSPPFFASHKEQAIRKANLSISSQGLDKKDFSLWYLGTIGYDTESNKPDVNLDDFEELEL